MSRTAARSKARAAARLAAVQALYQHDMEATPIARLLTEFHHHRLGATIEGAEYAEADIDFFDDVVSGAHARLIEIDLAIEAKLATGWTLVRLDKPMKAILRAGTYELLARADVAAGDRDQRICRRRPRLLRKARGGLRERRAGRDRQGGSSVNRHPGLDPGSIAATDAIACMDAEPVQQHGSGGEQAIHPFRHQRPRRTQPRLREPSAPGRFLQVQFQASPPCDSVPPARTRPRDRPPPTCRSTRTDRRQQSRGRSAPSGTASRRRTRCRAAAQRSPHRAHSAAVPCPRHHSRRSPARRAQRRQQFAVHMQHSLRPGALVQIVDVLRDDQQFARPPCIQPRQRPMRRIWFDRRQRRPPRVVKAVHQHRIARQRFGRAHVLDP